MALKFQTVFSSLQSKILSGAWVEGTQIPTEYELCNTYGVSRITIRRALEELAKLGMISRTRGRGTFVSNTKYRIGRLSGSNDFFTFAEAPLDEAHDCVVLLAEKIIAPMELARTLELDVSENASPMVWHFERLVKKDGEPLAVFHHYFVEDIGDKIRSMGEVNHITVPLIEKIAGRKMHTIKAVVSALRPDSEIGKLLKVSPGSAHLWMRNVAYLDDGRPIETRYVVMNGDRSDFVVEIPMYKNQPDIHIPTFSHS